MDDATQVLGRRRVSAALWRGLDVMVEGLAQRRWRRAALASVMMEAVAGPSPIGSPVAVLPTTVPSARPQTARAPLYRTPSSSVPVADASEPLSLPLAGTGETAAPAPAASPALVIRARTPLPSRPSLTPLRDPVSIIVPPVEGGHHPGHRADVSAIPLPMAQDAALAVVSASTATAASTSIALPSGVVDEDVAMPGGTSRTLSTSLSSVPARSATAASAAFVTTAASPSPTPDAVWSTLVRNLTQRHARWHLPAVAPYGAASSTVSSPSPSGPDAVLTPTMPAAGIPDAAWLPVPPSSLTMRPWSMPPSEACPPAPTVTAPAIPSVWSPVRDPVVDWSTPASLPPVTTSAATTSAIPRLPDQLVRSAVPEAATAITADHDLIRRAVADLLREGARQHGIHIGEAGHG